MTVNRVTRMRPVTALPFTDDATRGDGQLEDTGHPWYTPVNSVGQRLEVIGGKLALPAGIVNGEAFLLLPSADVDLTFTFVHGAGPVAGSTGDMQVRLFLYDPTQRGRTPEPANSYLFATGYLTDGYTLSHVVNGVLTTVKTANAVFARGSTHTIRLRMVAGGFFRLYIDGTVIYQETVFFAADAGQLVLGFLIEDTSVTLDGLTVAGAVLATPGVDGVITDPFTRADGPLTVTPTGEAYTLTQTGGVHGAQVVSNQMSLGALAVPADVCRVFLDMGSVAQSFTLDLATVAAFSDGTRYLTTWLRWTTNNDCLLVQWSKPAAGQWSGAIYKVIGGVSTALATSTNFTALTPTQIKCQVNAAGVITGTFTAGANVFTITATENTRTGTKLGHELVGASVYDNLIASAP